jgi:hypothetical protein
MSDFYDWHKTLSYNADVTMVVGARGIGKTYGLRKQCIIDHIKKGYRWVEVVRYKRELSSVSDGYFDRLSHDPMFDNLIFRTDARYMYVAERVNDGETDAKGKPLKPQWHVCGYFVALTEGQMIKKRTYDNVRRIIFDEAVLERADRFHRYLPNEFVALANIVDTVSRERVGVDGIKPRLYLLGNACDIANPYFAAYGVGTDLQFGYRWYRGKTFLLHYVKDDEYSKAKLAGTVAGRMLSGTVGGAVAADNEFELTNTEFVSKKPKRCKFAFGIVCNGKRYGVWNDITEGLVYVTDYIPNGMDRRIYTLTASDSRVNYIMANRLSKVMQSFANMYWAGIVFYDTLQVKMDFQEILQMFGVK